MTMSITLSSQERNTLLDYLRRHPDPALRLRAHIILLLSQGYSWALITAVLFTSSRTIARWKERFQTGRVDALFEQPRGTPRRLLAGCSWTALLVGWVTRLCPRAFGFFRSRWCCATLALLLWRQHGICVSRETIRRRLSEADLVWRRPRPVLVRRDPEHDAKIAELRKLLAELPDDETAVFEDEVDLALNPKIGCMWMPKGAQAAVVTPGDNDKSYLAGSLHWRTGRLITTEGPKRDSALFVRHLEELCRRLRRYKKIHVICAYLTFPEDCKMGVCAHELGHLAFQWEDFYDPNGICVRVGGSDDDWKPSDSRYKDYREYAAGTGWKVWVALRDNPKPKQAPLKKAFDVPEYSPA
jgi:transposase